MLGHRISSTRRGSLERIGSEDVAAGMSFALYRVGESGSKGEGAEEGDAARPSSFVNSPI